MRRIFRRIAWIAFAAALAATPLPAQRGHDGDDNGLGPNGKGVMGTVTAVQPGGFTVKTADGEAWKVTVGDNTRITHDREPASIKEIKTGVGVLAVGQADASAPNTLHAVFASYQTADEVKTRFASFGKTWVAGKVTAIDGTKITITVQQPGENTPRNLTFTVDETTDFKKGRDEATLADLKTGDYVMGKGAVKTGAFVPTELAIRRPGEHHKAEGQMPPPAAAAPEDAPTGP